MLFSTVGRLLSPSEIVRSSKNAAGSAALRATLSSIVANGTSFTLRWLSRVVRRLLAASSLACIPLCMSSVDGGALNALGVAMAVVCGVVFVPGIVPGGGNAYGTGRTGAAL